MILKQTPKAECALPESKARALRRLPRSRLAKQAPRRAAKSGGAKLGIRAAHANARVLASWRAWTVQACGTPHVPMSVYRRRVRPK